MPAAGTAFSLRNYARQCRWSRLEGLAIRAQLMFGMQSCVPRLCVQFAEETPSKVTAGPASGPARPHGACAGVAEGGHGLGHATDWSSAQNPLSCCVPTLPPWGGKTTPSGASKSGGRRFACGQRGREASEGIRNCFQEGSPQTCCHQTPVEFI